MKVVAGCLWPCVSCLCSERASERLSLLQTTDPSLGLPSLPGVIPDLQGCTCDPCGHRNARADWFRPGLLPIPAAFTVTQGGVECWDWLRPIRASPGAECTGGAIPPQAPCAWKIGVPLTENLGAVSKREAWEGLDAGEAMTIGPLQAPIFGVGKGWRDGWARAEGRVTSES